MTEIIKKQVVAVLVDNEFGALARIVELFSARGCNIETLNVSPITSNKKLSRITITSYCSDKNIDLICKLLEKIVQVYRAAELTREFGYIERELALVKIIGDQEKRDAAIKIADKYRTHIVDITGDSIVFEIVGTSKTIDDILDELSKLGLDGISRTGVVAGFKGDKKLNELDYQY
jgi:acetolactate synthase-1/3 small subunit